MSVNMQAMTAAFLFAFLFGGVWRLFMAGMRGVGTLLFGEFARLSPLVKKGIRGIYRITALLSFALCLAVFTYAMDLGYSRMMLPVSAGGGYCVMQRLCGPNIDGIFCGLACKIRKVLWKCMGVVLAPFYKILAKVAIYLASLYGRTLLLFRRKYDSIYINLYTGRMRNRLPKQLEKDFKTLVTKIGGTDE